MELADVWMQICNLFRDEFKSHEANQRFVAFCGKRGLFTVALLITLVLSVLLALVLVTLILIVLVAFVLLVVLHCAYLLSQGTTGIFLPMQAENIHGFCKGLKWWIPLFLVDKTV